MTDGDVFFEKNCINEIYQFFKDFKVGAVCGRPMSLNSRKNMLVGHTIFFLEFS